MTELHAVFQGQVQGVGFRWSVLEWAEHFHLTGTVKNLSNGTVEVYAVGSKEDLDSFLSAIERDCGNAQIDSVTVDFGESADQFTGFKIVF